MTRTSTLLILLALACLLPLTARADEAAPAEVQRAAQAGLPEYVAALPTAQLADYGFRNREEAQRATLGRPYRLHSLSAVASAPTLAAALLPTDMWLYSVLVDGQPRTTLLVDRLADGYRAVQLGNTILPTLLQAWEARLAQQKLEAASVRFVRIPQLYTDFLLVSAAAQEFIAPLYVQPGLEQGAADALWPAAGFAPVLQRELQRSGGSAQPLAGAGGGGAAPARQSSFTLWYLAAVAAVLLAGGIYALAQRRRAQGGR